MSFAYVTPRDKPPVNVPALKGGEFLRFLLEGGEGELAICVRCGGGVSFFDSLPDGYTCTWCDGPMMPVGPTWWESMARRVRQVLKRDPTLLRKIKADWGAVTEGAPLPRLGPWFAWLNDVWKSVGYPRRGDDSSGPYTSSAPWWQHNSSIKGTPYGRSPMK